MTQAQAAELFALMLVMYDADVKDPEKMGQLYESFLLDMPYDVASRVLKNHMAENRFMPRIAEIRMPVFEQLCALPNFGDVMGILERAPRGQALDAHPVVKRALKECGGMWEFRHTKEGGRWREQFARAYKQHAEAFVKAASRESMERGMPLEGKTLLELKP